MKNNHTGRLRATKLIGVMILLIAILPMVSAGLDFDNIEHFDKNIGLYGKYEIRNSVLGIPFLQLNKVADLELTENTNTCGEECHAIKIFNLYEKGSLVDEFRTFTLQEDETWVLQDIRSYQFYVKTEGQTIDVDDYETQCFDMLNKVNGTTSKVCNQIKIGTHKEELPEWTAISLEQEFEVGTYEVKVIGHKKPSRTVDWQIKSNGIWTTEWATWGNISLGDDAEVTLNSPANNSISYVNPVTFNASANVTGGATLVNMSYFNDVGGWSLKNTTGNLYNYCDFTSATLCSGFVVGGGGTYTSDWDAVSDENDMSGSGNYDTTATAYIRYDTPISGAVNNKIIEVDLRNVGSNYYPDSHGFNGYFRLTDGADYIGVSIEYSSPAAINGYGLIKYTDSEGGSTTISTNAPLSSNIRFKITKTISGGIKTEYSSASSGSYTILTNNASGADLSSQKPTVSLYHSGSKSANSRTISGSVYRFIAHSGTTKTQTWNNTITGTTLWNVLACDTDGECGFAVQNFTILLDATLPIISGISGNGTQNYGVITTNHTINFTATDTNLDECWINYNSTNRTVSCTSGVQASGNFTLVKDLYSARIWANDTVGNINSQSISWDYKIFENSRTYNLDTYEGSTESFILNMTYNSALWNSISSNFNYAGINYSSTQTGVGNTILFTKILDIPAVDTTINNTLHWLISLTNATGTYVIQTDSTNQTVNKVTFSLCTAGQTPFVRFITRNQTSPYDLLNTTIKSSWSLYPASSSGDVVITGSFEDLTETNSSWDFCFSPNTTNYTASVNVEVDAANYTKNWHYITEAIYSNATTNVTIYLLHDDLATLTQLVVRDKSTQSPIEDAVIFIQLYDIGTDTYRTFGMAKTNFDGKDLSYLNWYDSFYKFIIVKDGTTLKTTTPFKISESPQIFEIEDITEFSYAKFRDFEYSLTYNNNTNNFILTFVKPSALVDQGCLRVIKRNVTDDYLICNTCESSSSATIYCNIAAWGNGTFIADFYATGSWYPIDTLQKIIGVTSKIYEILGDSEGTAYAILFAGMIVSMFLISPVLAIVGIIAAIFAASIIGFQPFDYFLFMGVAVVGGIIIMLLKK